MSHLDNSSLQFTTFSWKDFAARTHVESVHILEMITRSEPEGAIRGNTKIGPVLEVKVARRFVRCVIEILIGSV